jgi:hypothetical protein
MGGFADFFANLDAPKRYASKIANVLSDAVSTGAEMYGSASQPAPPEVVKGALSFAPVAGDAISAYDAYDAAKQGNYGEAALNAAGLLPFVPSLGGVLKKKQTVSIPAADALFEALGLPRSIVKADVDKLARKHPEHFSGPDDVEAHLHHVFGGAPDVALPASKDNLTLIARQAESMPVRTGESYRAAITDFTGARNGDYWVRSAYPMSAEQVAVKEGKAGGRVASPGSEVSDAHLSGAKPAFATASIPPEFNIPRTQYEINQEIARQNAVKLLGLNESNTAMDRAKAMGFDIPVFHGSNSADITRIDPDKFRQDVQYMPGFFTADSPEKAGLFGDVIYPLLQHRGVSVKEKRAARIAGKDQPEIDSIHDITAGVHVTNNPANIRSRFAAFDPAKKGMNDLMGNADPALLSVLAASMLSAAGGYKMTQEQQ